MYRFGLLYRRFECSCETTRLMSQQAKREAAWGRGAVRAQHLSPNFSRPIVLCAEIFKTTETSRYKAIESSIENITIGHASCFGH